LRIKSEAVATGSCAPSMPPEANCAKLTL